MTLFFGIIVLGACRERLDTLTNESRAQNQQQPIIERGTDVDFDAFWSAFHLACLGDNPQELLPFIADSFVVEGLEDGDKVQIVSSPDSIWGVVQAFFQQEGTVMYGGSWKLDSTSQLEVYRNPIKNHLMFIRALPNVRQYDQLVEDGNWKRLENMNFYRLAGEWKWTGVYMKLEQ